MAKSRIHNLLEFGPIEDKVRLAQDVYDLLDDIEDIGVRVTIRIFFSKKNQFLTHHIMMFLTILFFLRIFMI